MGSVVFIEILLEGDPLNIDGLLEGGDRGLKGAGCIYDGGMTFNVNSPGDAFEDLRLDC